jgi:DNA-binding protein H-NS
LALKQRLPELEKSAMELAAANSKISSIEETIKTYNSTVARMESDLKTCKMGTGGGKDTNREASKDKSSQPKSTNPVESKITTMESQMKKAG